MGVCGGVWRWKRAHPRRMMRRANRALVLVLPKRATRPTFLIQHASSDYSIAATTMTSNRHTDREP